MSYRRQDSAGHAGRVYDGLAARFGDDNVFMDVNSIRPGDPFMDVLERTLSEIDLMVVVLGPRWVTIEDDAGRRRLDDPDDFIRMEVSRALERDDVRVIPVRVAGAGVPSRDELPEPLRKLADRQAIELTDEHWTSDFVRLVSAIERKTPRPRPRPVKPVYAWVGAAAIAIVVLVGALLLFRGSDDGSSTTPTLPSSTFAAAIPSSATFNGPTTHAIPVTALNDLPFYVQFVHPSAGPDGAEDFAVDLADCNKKTLGVPGVTGCSLEATFAPQGGGTRSDTVTIRLRGGPAQTVADTSQSHIDFEVALAGVVTENGTGSGGGASTQTTPQGTASGEVTAPGSGETTPGTGTSGVEWGPTTTVIAPASSE